MLTKKIQRKLQWKLSLRTTQTNGYRNQCSTNYIENYRFQFLVRLNFYDAKVRLENKRKKLQIRFFLLLVDETGDTRVSTPSSLHILREKSVDNAK